MCPADGSRSMSRSLTAKCLVSVLIFCWSLSAPLRLWGLHLSWKVLILKITLCPVMSYVCLMSCAFIRSASQPVISSRISSLFICYKVCLLQGACLFEAHVLHVDCRAFFQAILLCVCAVCRILLFSALLPGTVLIPCEKVWWLSVHAAAGDWGLLERVSGQRSNHLWECRSEVDREEQTERSAWLPPCPFTLKAQALFEKPCSEEFECIAKPLFSI